MSALSLDFKYFPWYIILYNFLGVSFFCLFVWGVSVWVFFSFFLFSFLKEGPCFETKGGHSASCSKPLYIFTVKKRPYEQYLKIHKKIGVVIFVNKVSIVKNSDLFLHQNGLA